MAEKARGGSDTLAGGHLGLPEGGDLRASGCLLFREVSDHRRPVGCGFKLLALRRGAVPSCL